MTVSASVIEKIRDSKTIGKSIIIFINGILGVVLSVISGISDVNSTTDATYLRNLAIGFGAAVPILSLTLTFTIDVLISLCTDNKKDEDELKEMFINDPKTDPDNSILEGTKFMLSVLNQMKIASNNLGDTSINDQTVFKDQLRNLENALNNFGSMQPVV